MYRKVRSYGVLTYAGYMDLNIFAVAAVAIFVVRAEPLLKVYFDNSLYTGQRTNYSDTFPTCSARRRRRRRWCWQKPQD
jgi:hypothetical protein